VNVRLTFARVVRAEWAKMIALRSTWWTLGLVSILTVGLAGAIGNGVGRAVRGGDPPPTLGEFIGAAFLPIDLFTFVVGMFGVLQLTGEYGSGAIRASLTAVPRRWPVVLAKAIVLAAVTAPVMVLTSVAAFLTCRVFLGDGPSGGVGGLGDAVVIRAIAGAAAAPVLVGLLGIAVGALLRRTAAAISVLVAGLFVVPALLGPVLPGTLEEDVMKYVPTVAGQAMYRVGDGGGPFDTLSPGASALVLAGWVLLAFAGGVTLLLRRDA
jgi:ABC-2 type transport system permease protein